MKFLLLFAILLLVFPLRPLVIAHRRFSIPAMIGFAIGITICALFVMPGGNPPLLVVICAGIAAAVFGKEGQQILDRLFPRREDR